MKSSWLFWLVLLCWYPLVGSFLFPYGGWIYPKIHKLDHTSWAATGPKFILSLLMALRSKWNKILKFCDKTIFRQKHFPTWVWKLGFYVTSHEGQGLISHLGGLHMCLTCYCRALKPRMDLSSGQTTDRRRFFLEIKSLLMLDLES